MNADVENNFLGILEEELIPAIGCTEPIALAYAAAKMRETLGRRPERIVARCSGNMIKNVRCVQIPNSGGMVGIEAAVALGAFGGDAGRRMEVLAAVKPENIRDCASFVAEKRCQVEFLESAIPLHFIVEGTAGDDVALVEVCHSHANIVRIVKNGEVLYKGDRNVIESNCADRSCLSFENILAFVYSVALEKLSPIYDRVAEKNLAIAEEGLTGRYGVGIGPMIQRCYPDTVVNRMKACAAAGSEARMAGCDLPVIINSGSGNQGITSTVPVLVYCRERGIDLERTYRALALSSLLTVYQKEYIGKLSAYCGVVSAACAAGAAITYLEGGAPKQIAFTVTNALASVSGMICDGAKTSCALKIATALDCAMMAHFLAMHGDAYPPHTGILRANVDATIAAAGHVGRVGMRETDREILKLMLAD